MYAIVKEEAAVAYFDQRKTSIRLERMTRLGWRKNGGKMEVHRFIHPLSIS